MQAVKHYIYNPISLPKDYFHERNRVLENTKSYELDVEKLRQTHPNFLKSITPVDKPASFVSRRNGSQFGPSFEFYTRPVPSRVITGTHACFYETSTNKFFQAFMTDIITQFGTEYTCDVSEEDRKNAKKPVEAAREEYLEFMKCALDHIPKEEHAAALDEIEKCAEKYAFKE